MKTMPPAPRPNFHPAILVLCGALLFAACGTTKDAVSRNDIATLKTTHLAFIDEFTEAAGKTWDEQQVTSRTASVEKQFSDAERYETTKKKDATRGGAIANLHSQFKRHAGMLVRRKALFRPAFAKGLKDQVAQNYDQALRGEDIR